MSISAFCIGMGVVTSGGSGCDDFLDNLRMQRSSVRKIKNLNEKSKNIYYGAQICGYDYWDKYNKIAEQACEEAIINAGISLEEISKNDKISLIISTSLGNISVYEEQFKEVVLSENEKKVITPSIFPGMLNYITTYLENKYNITGPSYTVSNTCASGISGITLAYELLASGLVDICIVGGIDINAEFIMAGMSSLNALSSKSKLEPFSNDRDGIILGEGAGFIVLTNKRPDYIGKDNYGEVVGCSITNDAAHLMAPDKEAGGLIKSIRESIDMAEINADEIDCIFCCANGNVYNDAMQAVAIRETFKDNSSVAVTTIKPYIGHSLGAAGIIETIATLLMMCNDFIVPLSNDGEYKIDIQTNYLNYVFKAMHKKINYSILLSSGFSGVNGTVVLRKCDYERANK